MKLAHIHHGALTMALMFLCAPAAPAQDAGKTLYEAFYLESGVRRLDEAATKYAEAVELAVSGGDAALEAKARLGHARCLTALGELEAAWAEYEAVVRLDPENAEARAALERRELQGGIDPELRLKIGALVQKLGGPEREQASLDLERIGDLAVPFLVDGLRSRDVGVVEHAARLLASNGSSPALDAIADAFDDGEVLFPHLLLQALRAEVPDVDHPVWDRVIECPSSPDRSETLKRFSNWAGKRLESADRLRRLLEDEERYVRRETLEDLGEPVLSTLLPEVIARLGSPDAGERLAAVKRLRHVEGAVERAAAAAVTALGDDSAEVRERAEYAIRFLAKAGRVPVDVAHLAAARLLGDVDIRLVERGVELLRDFAGPWSNELRRTVMAAIDRIAASPETRREAAWLLEGRPELTDAELTALFHRARTPEWLLDQGDRRKVREACAKTIVRRQVDDTARVAWFRETWASTAGEAGQRVLMDVSFELSGESRVEALSLGATSLHFAVRAEAYDRLGKLSSVGRLPAFVFERLSFFEDDLMSSDDRVTKDLYRVASQSPRPEWEDAAAEFHAKRQESYSFRFLAACAGEHAADRAREALHSSNSQVRRRAVELLIDRVGAEAAGREVGGVAVEQDEPITLLAGFHDGPGLSGNLPAGFAAAFVGALPDGKITGSVIRDLFKGLPPAQFERVIDLGLASGDPDRQRAACEVVAATVYEPALGRITPLLDSPAPELRAAAEKAVDAIRARIERRTQAELLGPEGKAASIDRARKLLASDDPVKRQGGALALGALGDPSVVPLLLDLLEDPEPAVRSAALRALEALGSGTHAGG